MTTPAEHLRTSILDVLASAETPLSSAEIYERVDCAESKQSVAAQINYLKKAGKVASGMNSDGTSLHMLAVPVSEPLPVADQGAEIDAATPTFDLPDADLHRIVWSRPHGNAPRFLTLTIDADQPRLHTNGAFAIDPALLRQMADLIEALQQKEAA